jgi:hypothetical protein
LAIGNRKSKIRRPTRYRVVVLTSSSCESCAWHAKSNTMRAQIDLLIVIQFQVGY